jgi:DnaK suppressor protein
VEYDSDLVTDDDPERADERAIVGATSDPTAHPGDVTGETGELAAEEIDLELLDAIEQELADVELALDRLGDGTYGRCETCGQVLGEDELEKAPAGRYCRAHLPLVLP